MRRVRYIIYLFYVKLRKSIEKSVWLWYDYCMKLSHGIFGKKRNFIPIGLLLLFAVVLFGVFAVPQARSAGSAEVDWTVRVTYSNGPSSYVDLSTNDTYTGGNKLVFLVKGYVNGSTYSYYASKKIMSKESLAALDPQSWTAINSMGSTTEQTIGGEKYISIEYVDTSIENGGTSQTYFYFRRFDSKAEYYTASDGELYYWYITMSTTGGSDNDFTSIACTYVEKTGSAPTAYTAESGWTASPLNFTIGTVAEDNRVLNYSVDFYRFYNEKLDQLTAQGMGGDEAKENAKAYADKLANWMPVSGSGFAVVDSQNAVTIWLRLTDIDGNHKKYAYYGSGENGIGGNAVPLRVDMETPYFDVSATTHTVDGDQIVYESRSWSATEVRFFLSASAACLSGVRFQYSDNSGIQYMDLGSGELTVKQTTRSIRFRAISGAGKSYESSFEYGVNIDSVQPCAALSVFTVDPDLETDEYNKELSYTVKENGALTGTSETLLFDAANDKILLNVYNRDDIGNAITNTSGVTYYYQSSFSRNFTNAWQKMTLYKTEGNETYYQCTAEIASEIKMTRYYQFKIVSGAGKTSDIVEACVVVVNSVFDFELCEDYLEAKVNQTGWISDKAIIRVIMQTDSVYADGKYTEPTTEYSFYYWTEELTGNDPIAKKIKKQATKSVGSFVEFYDDKNGVVRWIYQFELRASANAFFNLRAVNAAGKLSAETKATPDPIKIDVLEPVTAMDAYIYPTDGVYTVSQLKNASFLKELADENRPGGKEIVTLDVNNPGWVNGAIYLVLCIDVGVSGVYLKNMKYVEETNATGTVTAGVWQEEEGQRTIDFNDDNSRYYYFITLSNDTPLQPIVSKEYRFRAYTGSGIYKEISFTANFDSSATIGLQTVSVSSETGKNNKKWSNVQAMTILSDGEFAVCEDYEISFASTIDRVGTEDHFALYYHAFSPEAVGYASDTESLLAYAKRTANYSLAPGGKIVGTVGTDSKGTVYYAVYAESMARTGKVVKMADGTVLADGEQNRSNYYIVVIDYDNYDVTINYSLDVTSTGSAEGDEITMENGTWLSGALEIKVTFPIDDNGDKVKSVADFTYYYMTIRAGVNGERPTQAMCEAQMQIEENWRAVSGASDEGLGVYSFVIPFTDESFFGVIGISVCNKAGYRSAVKYSSVKTIRIDNTVPDLADIFYDVTGVATESIQEGTSRKVISVYSSKEIYLDVQEMQRDYGHSPISYYYKVRESVPTDAGTLTLNTADMTALDGKLEVFSQLAEFLPGSYNIVYFVLFAKNTVADNNIGYAGTTSWSSGANGTSDIMLDTIYAFVYDPSVLTGTSAPDMSTFSFDQATNSYSSEWQETVRISLKASSDKAKEMPSYVKFGFSVDDGETWFDYMEAGVVNYYDSDKEKELTFTAESFAEYRDADGNYPFANGVSKNFTFRAVNKAGAEWRYEKVFIAMDETVPEFTIEMTDSRGLPYMNNASLILSNTDGLKWTSGPVTVSINITRLPASGVTFSYYLSYRNSAGNAEITQTKALLNTTFTTDMLDGFNQNRDAILTIIAVNNSHSAEVKQATQSVRISVDKVIPLFTMSAQSRNSDGTGGTKSNMQSGDWTNLDTVEVSKSVEAENVSPVVYTYTWQSSAMAEPTSHVWSETETSIKKDISGVLIVTATNGAGLTYTQTFEINIDTIKPVIKWSGGINVIENENYYIDLQVSVEEANINICEYITVITDTRGFAFNPTGYVLSTSSVDNSIRYDVSGKEYRGYVRVHVEDFAGNVAEFVIYVLPFRLTVNNITLDDADQKEVDEYEKMLNMAIAAGYMEESRITYFENLISRLRDRTETLKTEIESYQNYLEDIYNRSGFELRSDYADMLSYRETFENYEVYGQKWIQKAITGDSTSKYYTYYQRFLEKFDELFALKEQVENVEADVTALPAINMVAAEDYEDILRVWDEFYELTEEQWACFSANLENKLVDLKKACEVLMLYDKDTGIQIYGDFAEGARVRVTQYTSDTTTYRNAESLLLSTVENTAIVSIYRVGTYGASSQTVAGNAEIEMPIAEAYRDYIDFLVYSLSDDGSMTLLGGTKVQPDGETILIPVGDGEFGGTYVLCVKAAVEHTETKENVYGTLLGLELDTTMIKYLLYAGGALFAIVLVVCIILGIRHRRFLNSYNRAYRNSIYKKSSTGVPKGNKFRY